MKCSECYYYGTCGGVEDCLDYMPLTEEEEDRLLDEYIELERERFRLEWARYVRACDDSDDCLKFGEVRHLTALYT